MQQQGVAITSVSTCFYFTCKYLNILHLFDIQPFFNTNRTDVEGDENKICPISVIKRKKEDFISKIHTYNLQSSRILEKGSLLFCLVVFPVRVATLIHSKDMFIYNEDQLGK